MLVEIDAGAGRCGVTPGPEAVALAERIAASPHLIFGGLQSYHGAAQHLRSPGERAAAIAAAAEATRRTIEQCAQRGLACAIVGGAGTGTFALEAASGVWNEVQAGSHPFMDAGHKAVPTHSGMHFVWERPGLADVSGSDEHGKLVVRDGARPGLGEKLRLVPGPCDPTVDRFEWDVGVRRGRVELVWPITARGGTGEWRACLFLCTRGRACFEKGTTLACTTSVCAAFP